MDSHCIPHKNRHKVYFCCASHTFWTSELGGGKLAIYAPAITVILQTVHSCRPLGITATPRLHRLGGPRPTSWEPTISIDTRCVFWEIKYAKGRAHVFPTTHSSQNQANLMSLWEQQWLLLTGLRPVSKQSPVYTTIKKHRLVLQQSLVQDHSCADLSSDYSPVWPWQLCRQR